MPDQKTNRILGLLAILIVVGFASVLLVSLTRAPVVECRCQAVVPRPDPGPGAVPRGAGDADPQKRGPAFEWLKGMYDHYYPRPNTQGFEEMFIRDYFRDRRGGVFVDIGASHYRERSTTYYLEKHLGWSGIAVDALEEYREGYLRFRPETRFFSVYVGDKSDATVDFFVIESNKRLSSSAKSIRDEHTGDFSQKKVQTITMNDLLAKSGVERFDLLSMDIELAEPAALRGFDIEKHRPELVVIEMHDEVKAEIERYFVGHGYAAIEPYSDLDPLNDYFVPKERVAEFEERRGPLPLAQRPDLDAPGAE